MLLYKKKSISLVMLLEIDLSKSKLLMVTSEVDKKKKKDHIGT